MNPAIELVPSAAQISYLCPVTAMLLRVLLQWIERGTVMSDIHKLIMVQNYNFTICVVSLALHFRYIWWRHNLCAPKAACLVVNVGSVPDITLALHFSVPVAHPRIGIEVCNGIVIQLWSANRLCLLFACKESSLKFHGRSILLLCNFQRQLFFVYSDRF